MEQQEYKEDIKITNLKDKVDILDKLIQAVSRRFDHSNRYLLAILSISIIIAEGILNPVTKEQIKILSFEISSKEFYLFASLFLSILIITFSISYSHAVRSHTLALDLIKKSFSKDSFNGINVRDVYDSLISSSITKTAPLTQFLLEMDLQFLDKAEQQNKKWKRILIYFNLFLQLFVFIIFLLIMTIQGYTAYNAFYSHDDLLLGTLIVLSSTLSMLALIGIMSRYVLFSYTQFHNLLNIIKPKQINT